MLALGAAIIVAGQLRRRPSGASIILTLASAVGLTNLTGHAAASEGLVGTIHRAADALRMIAACMWPGAIAAFPILRRPAADDVEQPRSRIAAQSLERFAQVGTGCAIANAATWLIEFEMIAALEEAGSMLRSTYVHLLIAELLLFAGMLALAALNRWRLPPAFATANGGPSRP